MRVYLFVIVFSVILALSNLWGCSPSTGSLIVLEVGDETISLKEYEQLYERNLGSRDAARQTSSEEREKFLDLLTNYKLKLRDAYARNLLQEKDVQDELHDYRTSVAITFMIDREVTEPALRTMYERRKEELRASHILIRIEPNAVPEDTLKAWNRAMEIIKQINEGKDFAALAQEMSEDQSARKNKGDLYYFTTGQMVPTFEDAVYALRVGEYTIRPVRTPFGYHIIKLTDRKPTVYSISVSHIMVATKPQSTDSAAVDSALVRIRTLQYSLKGGHDFGTLAKRYSDDPGSASRGGSLGYFSRRRFIQEFENVAFKLKPGEVSDIVKTLFGYHIIKCNDIRPLPSYDEMRSELQRIFQQYRYDEDYRQYMNRWKERLGFSRNDLVLQQFFSHLDSTKLPHDSLWAVNVPNDIRQNVALTIGQRTITVDSLITIITTRNDYKDSPITSANFSTQIDKIGNFLVVEMASIGLEDRYPDFKNLMKEFQDGVVLYKAEQQEVWNKIEVNENKLRAFYAERQSQYPLPNRVEFLEVTTDSQPLARKLISDVKKSRLLDTLIARSKGKLQKNSRGLIAADTDTLSQLAWANEVGSMIGPVWYNKRYVIVQVVKKDPARYKTFEEASAEISTVFQEHESKRLEREWLERLKTQYSVMQHKELLEKAFAGERPSS